MEMLVGTSDMMAELAGDSLLDFFRRMERELSGGDSAFATDKSRTSFVEHMIAVYWDYFVDYETGRANFESEEFIALLEVARLLEEEDSHEIHPDILIGARGEGFTFLTLDVLRRLETMATMLQLDHVAAGFPNAGNGQPRIVMRPRYLFAVSAHTENVETAWQFLRTFYEDIELNRRQQFPIDREAFSSLERWHASILDEWYLPENFIPTSGGYYIDEFGQEQEFIVPRIPLAEAKGITGEVKELIEQVNSVFFYDPIVFNFIHEELPAFFHGNRTAEETGRILQNWVSTYLAEMR